LHPVSESPIVAEHADPVLPGLWTWTIQDPRIGGFASSSHALATGAGLLLIDPHRLREDALAELGEVSAILLTCGPHQRSAWHYRRELGVPVYAPQGLQEIDEEADHSYGDGEALPGGLRTVFAPGPGTKQYVLLSGGDPKILFAADHFVHPPGGELGFVSDEFVHDPAQTKETVKGLLDLDFDVLCTGHGPPLTDDPKSAIRALFA
jgi:glyoxylase-like metal-dependent hydrolase (beta-lactamase superfamily II)